MKMELKIPFVILLGWTLTAFCFGETMLKPKFLFEFGQEGAGNGEFIGGPKDVAIDLENKVYVLDDERIQVFTSNGVFLAKFGSVGNGPQQFSIPHALAVGRLGNVYVTDADADCVHVFDKNFQYIQKFGSTGNGEGQLINPGQIAVDGLDAVYVVDRWNKRVAKFDSVGGFLTNFNFPGSDIFGLTFDPLGNWLITCIREGRNFIQSYDFQGNFLNEIETKSEGSDVLPIIPQKSVLYDLAVYQGDICIGSIEQFNVMHFYTLTNYLTQFGVYGKNPAQFQSPCGVVVNSQRDKLYISDYNNYRIQVFSFEWLTNLNAVATNGNYHSGDFTGDEFGDILVYRKAKRKKMTTEEGEKISILNVSNNVLSGVIDVSLPQDWMFSRHSKLRKVLVGQSLGIYSSLVFCRGKQFILARYWVDPFVIQNEFQEEKILPVPFKIGHVRASGDVNKDGILDIILTKKQTVKVLLGPDYVELKEVTGLPARLPGRVRAMYHEGSQDNVLVFQKGKRVGQGYFIDANFVATVGPKIEVNRRIRAMSGATPVTQKKRTISMGAFTYSNSEPKKNGKLRVVGPR